MEPPQTLNQALLAAMATHARLTCFQVSQGGRYRDISYQRFQRSVLRLASFFQDYGLSLGDRLAIIADNCLEWMVAYVACLLSGGVAVPLPTSLTSDMLGSILCDAGARLAVVHDARQGHILERMLTELPDLETILAVNAENLEGAFPMASILTKSISLQKEDTIRAYAESIGPDTLASIHYTAGKADTPDGAVFDQAQRLSAMRNLAEWFALRQDDLAFTFAPWSYMPSLDASLHYFLSGVANVLAESRQTVYENLQQTSPSLGLVAPYVLERFYNMVMDRTGQLPESSRDVFYWALARSREYHSAGLSATEEVREAYARADMTFFSQIRGWMGGRLRRLYSTGAPLSQQLVEFLEALGLQALNVYNVTEAGGFPAASLPNRRRADACGRVGPGFQIRIAEDGEVLVRGETVMRRYWQQPEGSQQVVDEDGWLHTGDLGRFDKDGYLYLTGRKEPLIVLSTGRKVVPMTIESALVKDPHIDQAIVFGDGRLYVSALIVPNLETITASLREDGEDVADLSLQATSPKVRQLLDRVVDEVNRQLARWEQIRGYTVLDHPLFETSHEPAMAAKRHREAIAQQFASQIDGMYPMPVRLTGKEVTSVQIEPERLRGLLEKQDILDAWVQDAGIGFLFDLARNKQIDGPAMVNICDTAVAIAQMQNEEKPLSTALIVGDPSVIARVLPSSEIQLQRYDHIRRMRQVIVTLAKMVDGLVLGYAVDKHGYLRGIHKLDIDPHASGSVLLGPRFRRHAAVSHECDAVVLFVPPGGRQVRVFADGRPIGRYANGSWSPEGMQDVDEAVARLAEQKGVERTLLEQVVRCAFRMSEQNLGAIFVLGDAEAILKRSDSPELRSFARIASTDVGHLSDQELINFAKQDGATVIDGSGRFRDCMVLLRPAADTEAEIGLGKGARHSSASKTSAEAQCLTIVVSQDGPITVYDSGRRVLSL
jgi:long-chain acyl-CoA synthetase